MEITPIQQINLKIENTEEKNEVAAFISIIEKCVTQSCKAGLKNTFTDEEKELLGKIAKGLGIEQERTLYE